MNESATFGSELRRVRQASGVSLNDLADRIHYSKGYLSKVETGIAPGNESLARLCDTELGTGGTLVALLPNGSTRRRAVRASAQPIAGLPALTAHFAGRDDDVSAVLQVLRDQPVDGPSICAIDGMAGVGKTALAVRCANRLEQSFADGCLFLDLRGHSAEAAQVRPADALGRLLRLLGVPAEAIPGDVDDRALLYRDRLRGRSMLIVLDNAHSAGQVRPLLPGEPKCRVLITSRRRLVALDDARHVSLDVLPPAGAAELFRSLAGVDTADSAVTSLVSRCGLLPLAIRIAAARFRSSPTDSVADFDRRLADKSGRLAELDDGERSVAAVFGVWMDDLGAEQRAVFSALALHPGTDLDLHSAAALCGRTTRDIERLIGRLCDANLVEARASSRYRFHDLLHDFAVATADVELRPAQRADATLRLLNLELVAADAADRALEPRRFRKSITVEAPDGLAREFPDEDAALAWLRVEWPNLVALCAFAVENGYPVHGWQLAFSLRSYFFLAKLWDPWLRTQELALTAAEASGDAWAEAVTLNNLGMARIDSGELEPAADYFRRALARFREIDDQHGVTTALANDAWVSYYRGDGARALADLRRALEFYRRTGADRNVAITLRGMALVEASLDATDDAIAHAELAMLTFEELGTDLDVAFTHNCLGWAHFRTGDHDRAVGHYRDALTVSDRCGSVHEAARAETGLGNVAASRGDEDAAKEYWAAADRRSVSLNIIMVQEVRIRMSR